MAETRRIAEQIEALRPKTVILGGWSPDYEPLLHHFRQRGPFWVVYWLGSAVRMESAGELESYLRVLSDRRVGAMLYADPSLGRSALARVKPSDVLPICLGTIATPPASARQRARPVVSLFCAEREVAQRNVLVTLLALADVRNDFVLHLNGLAQHAEYRDLLHALRIPHRDLGWMTPARYERAVRGVDLGLQVSWVQDHVAIDHGVQGIPVVGSDTAPPLRNLSAAVRLRLAVNNPGDVEALRRKIEYLLVRPAQRIRLGAAVRRQLILDDARNLRVAHEVLACLA